MERKHAAYQNDGKSCYSENQISQVKALSVTILSINVIHSLENSGDNFSRAYPHPSLQSVDRQRYV